MLEKLIRKDENWLMLSLLTSTLLSNLILVVIVVFVTVAHLRLIKAHHKLEKRVTKSAAKKLASAREKSDKLIEEAVVKASEIVNLSEIFAKHARKELDGALSSSTKNISEGYEEVLADIEKSTVRQLSSLSGEIKKMAVKDVSNFKRDLEEQVVNYRSELRLAADKAQIMADKEIANYKAHKLDEFERLVRERVDEVAMQVFGKSISLKDHVGLVVNALEKAKKEGIFG